MARVPRHDVRDALDAATAALFVAFDQAEVPALLLKGPVLARVLYAPGEERMYRDVDVLVEPAKLERARVVLREWEGICVREMSGVEDVGGGLHAEAWMLRTAVVDLHWRLPASDAPSEVIWKALHRSHQLIDIEGHRVATLSRAGLALHIAIHAAQHGGKHGPGQRDLELSLERWPREVWGRADALAREIGAADAFAVGLQLTPAGGDLARALALPHISQLNWTPDEEWTRGTYYIRAFATAGSVATRARIVRRALLPPSRWILCEYPWARRWQPLRIAGYAMHLMRAPLWASRALRLHRRHPQLVELRPPGRASAGISPLERYQGADNAPPEAAPPEAVPPEAAPPEAAPPEAAPRECPM